MNPQEYEVEVDATSASETEENNPEEEISAGEDTQNSQDPLQEELNKVKKRGEGKTELEKALYTRQKLDKRINELKGDDFTETVPDEDDNKPVTVGMLKKIQQSSAQRTALQLADEIGDESERELTKHYLQTRIVPSGDPKEDLRFARAAVNSVKNSQIAEEVSRKGKPKSTSSAPGASAKNFDTNFTPTAEEADFMRSFGLTKEEILDARKKNAQT